ncbi:TetR family transcriptional regulator [Lactobacillus nasalidis]|uniref:TetR family transcriptional regulator n=1 Tax=Lactobacillus nasalidis TaxID=2797258 RepID=A0ABQ3W5Z4_9LACO|nr:TetR/AcrR family transcriptional regulator [Lactobacillus nasalidis]GHV98272.1 TetR family transcriptional regulator [Lactobacillus nasalidis]GHV99397.1 TetR family transcriptional regulator [Lactobacillus nasalidis]GHW01973.1 TetR family transcriptional regulator [Lactobacillus nasalidis]
MTTEEKICQALLAEMEHENVATIKVKDLIKRAGISRSTFYNHYSSVQDVMEDLEMRLFSDIPANSGTIEEYLKDRKQLHELILVKFAYIKAHLREFQALTGPNGDPYFQYHLGRFFLPELQQFENRGESVQLTLANEGLNGARMSIISWWIRHPNQISLEELADFLTDFLTSYIIFIKNKRSQP